MARSRYTRGGKRAATRDTRPIGWRVWYTEFETYPSRPDEFLPRYKWRRFSDQTEARSFASKVQHQTPDDLDPDVSIDPLYRFEVAYHDQHDRDDSGTMILVGTDAEEVEEKFYDSADAEGWVVSSVTRIDSRYED